MALIDYEKAEALRSKWGISYDQLFGLRFAINVAIATTIVWITLKLFDDTNPIWAIASMVAASDPQPVEARRMFKARLSNVLVGCSVGLVFVIIGGGSSWVLPIALAIAVFVSTWFVKIKTMWRQAPITTAVVIAASVFQDSTLAGIGHGLHKVGEVIFGCLVGVGVSYVMSKVWILKIPESK